MVPELNAALSTTDDGEECGARSRHSGAASSPTPPRPSDRDDAMLTPRATTPSAAVEVEETLLPLDEFTAQVHVQPLPATATATDTDARGSVTATPANTPAHVWPGSAQRNAQPTPTPVSPTPGPCAATTTTATAATAADHDFDFDETEGVQLCFAS